MKVFILLNAGLFLLFGLGFMFFPEALSLYFTDASPATSSGLTDMRAVYGGIALGLAVVLGLMSRDQQLHSFGTIASMLIVGSMAVGRTLGMVQDGSPNNFMYINLALEISAVVFGWILLHQSKRKNK